MPEQRPDNHRHSFPWLGLSRVTAIALAVASFDASPALADSLPTHHHRAKTHHITPVGDVAVTQTDPTSGEYLSPLPNQAFMRPAIAHASENNQVITVNDKVTYQRFEGIGAAMTDSSAWLIQDELTPANRAKLMNDLFSKSGERLNFLRIPMGASDFTRDGKPYSYDDMPPGQTDPTLSHFSIAHDRAYIIPVLHEAEADNPHITFSMNPWSPPGWMKANDSLDNNDGAGVFLPQYNQQFANYEVKSLGDYDRAGIPIKILVPTNEPNVGTLYPGLNLSAANEGTYINQYLYPALNAAGLNDVKVYGNDLSWDATGYANTVLQMVPHLGGLAWHCYTGDPAVMKLYPNVNEIMDECSNELPHFAAALIMAEAFRDNVSIASVWNIALQPGGGPVQPPDKGCPGCFGVVTVNPETHTYRYTRRYFQLGQYGHFIMRGAVRIDSQASDEPAYDTATQAFAPGLVDVAFENPDGTKELVVYNNNISTTTFNVNWNGRVLPNYKVAPGATTTFSWKK